MKKILIALLIVFSFFSAFLYAYFYCKKCTSTPAIYTPKIQTTPTPELLSGNKNISYLYSIAVALEKFKSTHRSYPISEFPGTSWNRSSKDNERWIEGLSPDFIKKIPVDADHSSHPAEQYVYLSDGANYKLIVGYPNDCHQVKKIQPKLIAPVGDCIAYGFWTSERASYW